MGNSIETYINGSDNNFNFSRNIVVSIIIPIYNAEAYLLATLHSIQRQTYKNWEAICVDDGSSDSSQKIVRLFTESDNRFTLLTQKNEGPGAARNKGLSAISGKYVMFQDSDDLLHPVALEYMVAEADQSEADVAICGYTEISENAEQLESFFFTPAKTEIYTDLLPERLDNWKKFRGHPWGKLYKSPILSGIDFPDLLSAEDVYFTIDVFTKANKVIYVPISFYYYRQRRESLTNSIVHHQETIEASRVIALHCIDLFTMGKITFPALQKLLQRYGTNAIMLHLLLMSINASLPIAKKKYLLMAANEALWNIRKEAPKSCQIIANKYYLPYHLTIKNNNIYMIVLFSKIRSLLLKIFLAANKRLT